MTIILIIIGFIVFIFLADAWDKNDLKKRLERSKLEDEKKRAPFKAKIEELKMNLQDRMYNFGRKNFKIRKATYDIEEGGEYLSEFNEYDCIKIDKIIEDELRSQSPYFYDDPFALGTYPNSIYEKTIQRIEKRILTELKTYTKTDDSYMGF